MKGANLSSPSVAYRHLQKLEDLGYLQKNEYGEYTVKSKAHVRGYSLAWSPFRCRKCGSTALLFSAILIVELFVLIMHFSVENIRIQSFLLAFDAYNWVGTSCFHC